MLKALGMIFVIVGTSGVGFSMAISVKRTTAVLQQLLSALELMKHEISYKKTPLPELMRIVSLSSKGGVADFFGRVASDCYQRQEASVNAIVKKCLAETPASVFPSNVRQILLNWGNGLGKYDVTGQLCAIDLANERLRALLNQYQAEQTSRMRSYCTLGVCAGLAIAIILL